MGELLKHIPVSLKARMLQAVKRLGAWPHRIRAGRARDLVLHVPFARRQYISGDHEPHVAEALWRRLGSDMVALDIGAHMGYHTLLMARRVGRHGSVFAFEPVVRHARRLRRSMARNRLSQVTVVEEALGATVADAWIVEGSNDAMGRVVGDRAAGGRPVSVTTLDAWAAGQSLPRLDLVKLDVEGQELEALDGGAGFLRQYRPDIVCEVHWSRWVRYRPRQLVDWLRTAGYEATLLDSRDRPVGDLDDVLRYTETVEAPNHLVVFHILATITGSAG